jgi:hypothetical protein
VGRPRRSGSPACRSDVSAPLAGAAQCAGLVLGQWVGSGAQQLAGVGIEEHQRGGVDADADAAATVDLRGEQSV